MTNIDIFWKIFSDLLPQLLSIIAIVVTLIIYFAERKVKGLSVKLVSEAPIMNSSDTVDEKIQILFNGESVKNPHLAIIEICNNGNVPIQPSDYIGELTIQCNDISKILTAGVYNTKPTGLPIELSHSENKIFIKPLLLNDGDTFFIKALIEQFDGTFKVNGRIVGIRKFSVKVQSSIQKRIVALGIGVFLSLMVNYANVMAVLNLPIYLNYEYTLFFQIISFLLLFYAAGVDLLIKRIFHTITRSKNNTAG